MFLYYLLTYVDNNTIFRADPDTICGLTSEYADRNQKWREPSESLLSFLNQLGVGIIQEKDIYGVVAPPRSLMEYITNSLKDAIIEGRLQPGQQIVEKKLQETIGVSRAPIREALLKLEGQGLVEIVPRKGTFVKAITPRFLEESFTIRAWMEGLAARLSLQHLTKEDYSELDSILEDMARLADQKDYRAYFNKHWEFHDFFIKGSNNELLIEKIEILRRQSLWIGYSITYFEKKHAMSQKIHKKIITTFKRGNQDAAEKAVRNHILDAIPSYIEFLEAYYAKSK